MPQEIKTSEQIAEDIVEEMIDAGAFNSDNRFWAEIWKNVIIRHLQEQKVS